MTYSYKLDILMNTFLMVNSRSFSTSSFQVDMSFLVLKDKVINVNGKSLMDLRRK